MNISNKKMDINKTLFCLFSFLIGDHVCMSIMLKFDIHV